MAIPSKGNNHVVMAIEICTTLLEGLSGQEEIAAHIEETKRHLTTASGKLWLRTPEGEALAKSCADAAVATKSAFEAQDMDGLLVSSSSLEEIAFSLKKEILKRMQIVT
ncbi:MAG: hypothetical protein SWK90_08695 [Chloroflexota bacterium]|nr:hypothetical protein [Chloroflexota bacterium]